MNKLVIVFLLSIFSMHAVIAENNLPPETKVYYWYYVKLGKILDKETGTNRIIIKNIGSEIKSGTFDEFKTDHLLGLKSGKIAIGPFPAQSQVQKSQYLFKYAGKEIKDLDEDSSFSFFYVKPMFQESQQEIKFERIPARVTTGTQGIFGDLLDEGLSFEKLAIGPFYDYELAEKSKFVFRKNGELGEENVLDTLQHVALVTMAKKWKTLHLDIVKQPDNKNLNKYLYRFNTKFPRKYFDGNTFQTITIKAMYSTPVNASSNSFTLQGDGAADNNPVISYELGTVYINLLNFDKPDNAKIKGFLFESFVYNDSELIELEPIYISMK